MSGSLIVLLVPDCWLPFCMWSLTAGFLTEKEKQQSRGTCLLAFRTGTHTFRQCLLASLRGCRKRVGLMSQMPSRGVEGDALTRGIGSKGE